MRKTQNVQKCSYVIIAQQRRHNITSTFTHFGVKRRVYSIKKFIVLVYGIS